MKTAIDAQSAHLFTPSSDERLNLLEISHLGGRKNLDMVALLVLEGLSRSRRQLDVVGSARLLLGLDLVVEEGATASDASVNEMRELLDALLDFGDGERLGILLDRDVRLRADFDGNTEGDHPVLEGSVGVGTGLVGSANADNTTTSKFLQRGVDETGEALVGVAVEPTAHAEDSVAGVELGLFRTQGLGELVSVGGRLSIAVGRGDDDEGSFDVLELEVVELDERRSNRKLPGVEVLLQLLGVAQRVTGLRAVSDDDVLVARGAGGLPTRNFLDRGDTLLAPVRVPGALLEAMG